MIAVVEFEATITPEEVPVDRALLRQFVIAGAKAHGYEVAKCDVMDTPTADDIRQIVRDELADAAEAF